MTNANSVRIYQFIVWSTILHHQTNNNNNKSAAFSLSVFIIIMWEFRILYQILIVLSFKTIPGRKPKKKKKSRKQ